MSVMTLKRKHRFVNTINLGGCPQTFPAGNSFLKLRKMENLCWSCALRSAGR